MNLDEAIKYKNIAVVIAAVLSLLAIFSWDYGYYVFLRWVVLVASGLVIYTAHKLNETGWVVAGAIVLILWNPFVSISLDRSVWAFLNIGAAVMFFMAKNKLIHKSHAI